MINQATNRSPTSKPVLFVTGHAPFDRVGAFARLHEREGVEFALFGGRSQHGGTANEDRGELPFPHRHLHQRELARLAASGRHRAVVVSTGGRIALPAAWAGARRAGVPVILWSALWAHPRTAAHAFSYLALRHLYRSAEAVVVYGSHVEAYVRARGARNVHIAPQSVDNEFWSHPLMGPDASPPVIPGWPPAPSTPSLPATPATPGWPPVPATSSLPATSATPGWLSEIAVKFLFAGRPVREKGVGVLIEAWSESGLRAPSAALVLVGVGSTPPWVPAGGAARQGVVHGANQDALETAHRDIVCLDPVRLCACATSTPPPTSSWCPRSPPAPSASRGGWWSTRL